ncbi:hypothetical protein DMB65_14390 [Flavobacterium cheongpyeongense]|jgi:hypothetical protein|uniref:Uncharacterized protein n=1 Tax=Flavobacterium cheongpyeongense TaxID=2212651 RepID=A0A2V4BLY8_9FLAO|nr:hypothetical protein [Flavobacterium cheongpyeongense]PXY39978.1 hypothetical protein DMB65_14390 [Flavobacterium cheongpyeongense]
MEISKIRLAYRVVIDSSSTIIWDKYVFEDTFKEYKMQSQQFNSVENPKNTFRELLAENEKAVQLHFLVGIAADGYVQQLKGNFHRVSDVLGNQYFPFINYQLDIVNSDITDHSKHKIGITFYSPLLTYFGIIERNYLVSRNTEHTNGYETMMFPVQSHLSICYIQKE